LDAVAPDSQSAFRSLRDGIVAGVRLSEVRHLDAVISE
jgi:hypothetical protein